ncbi:MAG: hypothetical protein HRT66_06595 [Flavobacteriaceae bacterium]|nr:hypothetical protein [Flavobacteriaceae bacterium]NRB65348.1 hypothetical protein [Saprospiraceae bacterium]
MKKAILIIYTLSFVFIFSINAQSYNLRFTCAQESSSEGEASIKRFSKKLYQIILEKGGDSSRATFLTQDGMFLDMIRTSMSQNIQIQTSGDTIWRTEHFMNTQGVMNGWQLFKTNGLFGSVFALNNVSLEENELDDLFKDEIKPVRLEKDITDRKNILGYDCFKVILEIPEILDDTDDMPFPIKLGNSVYEMYVTNDIDLPMHALINVPVFLNFFPLEVFEYTTELKGNFLVYNVISVD